MSSRTHSFIKNNGSRLINQLNSEIPSCEEEDDPEYLVLTFDNNAIQNLPDANSLENKRQVKATTRLTARLTNSSLCENESNSFISESNENNEACSVLSSSLSESSSITPANSSASLRQIIHYKHYSEPKISNSKMLKCIECSKYYRNQYSLQHHICLKRKDVWRKGDVPSRMVDGHLTYFCPICYKPFKWLGNLTRHFYVHTGQRFFKCNMCDKEFFSAYQVKRHMNSHTGVRYKCEICERAFTCKYACAWHTRQHYTNNNSNEVINSSASISTSSSLTTANSNCNDRDMVPSSGSTISNSSIIKIIPKKS